MPTLADLLALPAGRGLDCAIAELLGEKPPAGAQYSAERHEWVLYCEDVDIEARTVYHWEEAWPSHRSTTIAAAWPLMAEMLADEEPVELYFLLVFDVRVGDIVASVPTIDDAPLAITRAWLVWKLQGEQP